jgi:hypothetical protein
MIPDKLKSQFAYPINYNKLPVMYQQIFYLCGFGEGKHQINAQSTYAIDLRRCKLCTLKEDAILRIVSEY